MNGFGLLIYLSGLFNQTSPLLANNSVNKSKFAIFNLGWLVLLGLLLPIQAFAHSVKASKPVADLRADVNRDGLVDIDKSSESGGDKKGQHTWTVKRGAIVLPNLDDDAERCDEATAIRNLSVTACNDSKDTIINGEADFTDLAELRLMPWRGAPNHASATIHIAPKSAHKARLFIQKNGRWVMFQANQPLTARELRAGSNLRLEALDVVRDKRHWDGNIDVFAMVTDGKTKVADHVRFHVAPLIVQTDLMPVEQLYLPGMPWGQDDPSTLTGIAGNAAVDPIISRPSAKSVFGYLSILDAAKPGTGILSQSSVASAEKLGLLGSAFKAFYDDFVTASSALRPLARIFDLSTFEDPWVQDMYEMAFATMPKPDGKVQIMHIALRSPQPQRWSAQLPLVELLGPNVGIVEQWADDSGFAPNSGEYSSNSTGNFGTIPPYSYRDKNYPLGRVLFGAGKAWMQTGGGIIDSSMPGSGELVLTDRFPDKTFVKLLSDQGMQKPMVIDTAWLAVGHIDEIVAFVPADSRRGWKVVVADPAGAWGLLTNMADKGLGATKFLSGLEPWATGIQVELLDRTVADVANDAKIEAAQRIAHSKIASVINVLKRETGINDDEIIRVPVLFEPTFFNEQSFIALTPSAANLVALGQNKVAVAKQHGPLVNGVDVFEEAVTSALQADDLSVFWVEDYIQAHGGSGEIHCQSNTLRKPGSLANWWKRGHRTKHNEG